jgi:hypothetical protein
LAEFFAAREFPLAFASELDKGSRSGQDIGRAGYDKRQSVLRSGPSTRRRVILSDMPPSTASSIQ